MSLEREGRESEWLKWGMEISCEREWLDMSVNVFLHCLSRWVIYKEYFVARVSFGCVFPP